MQTEIQRAEHVEYVIVKYREALKARWGYSIVSQVTNEILFDETADERELAHVPQAQATQQAQHLPLSGLVVPTSTRQQAKPSDRASSGVLSRLGELVSECLVLSYRTMVIFGTAWLVWRVFAVLTDK